jgi:hypothetical protein
MGTSTSFRAPAVPRWQAFTTALTLGLPVDRIQSEMFNAGAEWQAALAQPAVAELAVAAQGAREALAERIQAGVAPDQAVGEYVAQARALAEQAGASSALAIGERALRAWLVRTGADALAGPGAAEAAGLAGVAPANPVAGYLGELLGQYARHVTSREIGRLTEASSELSVREARQLTRRLAVMATEIGRQTDAASGDAGAVREQWSRLVADAFGRGRRLPEGE